MGFNKYLLRLCPTEAEKEKAEASKTESGGASNFLKPLQYSFMDRLGDEREVELSPMQFVTNFDISGKIEESDDALTEIDLKETTTVVCSSHFTMFYMYSQPQRKMHMKLMKL